MPEARLSKVLAAAGIASRRGADELIAGGRVTVDGRPAVLGERVDPERAAITVDGRSIASATAQHVYLAMHKPAGVTSTVRDRHAERTVLDLVPPDLRATRLYPVGRLDRDSEGLILLTNDGDWADAVLHPRHAVAREYAVAVRRPLDARQLATLTEGLELEEGLARASAVREQTRTETRRLAELVEPPIDPVLTWYRATLEHGWKRQLRRMFRAVHAPVQRLVRVRLGPLRIDDLRAGEVRPLGRSEIRRLAPRTQADG